MRGVYLLCPQCFSCHHYPRSCRVSDWHLFLHNVVLDQGTYLMLEVGYDSEHMTREYTSPAICPRSFQPDGTLEHPLESTSEALAWELDAISQYTMYALNQPWLGGAVFLKTRRHGFGNRVGIGGTLIIPPSDSLGELVFCFSSTLVFFTRIDIQRWECFYQGTCFLIFNLLKAEAYSKLLPFNVHSSGLRPWVYK